MIYNTNDRLTAFEPAADTVKRIQTVRPQEAKSTASENKIVKEIDQAIISDSALKSLEEMKEESVKKNGNKDSLNNKIKSSAEAMGIHKANKINYLIDDDNNVTLQLIDSKSDEVIKEIPPEAQARISKAIDKILEETNKKSSETRDNTIDSVV